MCCYVVELLVINKQSSKKSFQSVVGMNDLQKISESTSSHVKA